MSKSLALRWVILAFTCAIATTTSAQPAPARGLTEFGLKDLMNIQAGAAIFAITKEDIHRAGATNAPDLLWIVPAVIVALRPLRQQAGMADREIRRGRRHRTESHDSRCVEFLSAPGAILQIQAGHGIFGKFTGRFWAN